jgi:HEAT repeat protein
MNWFWVFAVLVFIVGTVVALVAGYHAARAGRRAALIAGTELKDVQDLKRGVNKIQGAVRAKNSPLRSPWTDRDCVWYSFVVEELRVEYGTDSRGRSTRTHHWVPVVRDVKGIEAAIDDGTGEVQVRLKDAEVVVKSPKYAQSGLFSRPSKKLRKVIEGRYAHSTTGFFGFDKEMRFKESVLREGTEVVALGKVAFTKAGEARLVKSETPLLVSDKDSDDLGSHYRMRAVLCWLGCVAALLAFSAIGTGLCFAAHAKDQADALRIPPANGNTSGYYAKVIAALKSDDPVRINEALQALGRGTVDESARVEINQALLALIQSSPLPNDTAYKALERWGDASCIDGLASVIRKGGFHQNPAIGLLGKIKEPAASQVLAGLLDNEGCRWLARDALCAQGVVAEPAVLDILRSSKNKDTLERACDVLAAIGTAASLQPLTEMSRYSDFFVRSKAEESLRVLKARVPNSAQTPGPGPNPNPGPQPGLRPKPPPKPTPNPTPNRLSDNEYAQILLDLQSPTENIRGQAAVKLAGAPVDEERQAEVNKALEPLLREARPNTTTPALDALKTWGTKDCVPTLNAMLALRNQQMQPLVIATLGKIKDPTATALLVDALVGLPDRPATVRALLEHGPATEAGLLRILQGNRDQEVVSNAVTILGKHGTQNAVPVLLSLQQTTQDAQLRTTVVNAVAAIRARNPG